MDRLIARARIQISKPISEVYEGIVNHEIMTNYFISESTGRMENGREIYWTFPEFNEKCLVRDISLEVDRLVSFVWDEDTVVRILLEEQPDATVVVSVTEDGKEPNDKNLKWVIGNTEGWANFLACMKAWLEYGINLRKGSFEFMKSR